MLSETVSQGRRRSRFEIIVSILHACRRRGVKKTHLMNHCNMSFVQIKTYLDSILKANLVHVQNDGPTVYFRISSKGRRFLKAYENLKALIE